MTSFIVISLYSVFSIPCLIHHYNRWSHLIAENGTLSNRKANLDLRPGYILKSVGLENKLFRVMRCRLTVSVISARKKWHKPYEINKDLWPNSKLAEYRYPLYLFAFPLSFSFYLFTLILNHFDFNILKYFLNYIHQLT